MLSARSLPNGRKGARSAYGAHAARPRRRQMGRQMAMVFDLNKCIGCQTCSVACKVLWTNEDGKRDMWWCSVNTQPGRGTPRDYEKMGGGYDASGKLILGPLPTPADFGGASEFNWSAVHQSGNGEGHTHLQPTNGEPS